MTSDFLQITGERMFGKMTKILVLGKNGMLGSMVFGYLAKDVSLNITGTERNEFDAEKFLKNPFKFSKFKNFDYVINCIGIIKPYCKDNDPEGVIKAIRVNALFPHELAKFYNKSATKIIQIATDCVFSGRTGNYNEDSIHDPTDVYGMTKSLGEVFIGNFLNIRCSIIGPEKEKKVNLLEWFLSLKKEGKIKGFANHKWNGVTTLQFSQLVLKIIKKNKFHELRRMNHTHHFTPNNSVTKFELLQLFAKIFNKKIIILSTDKSAPSVNRTLSTKYDLLFSLIKKSSLEFELKELKNYLEESKNE